MSNGYRMWIWTVSLAAMLGCTGSAVRAGTPEGQYAIGFVDPVQYEHVHRDLLFTHNGDNRAVWAPQHDLARNNIQGLFAGCGLITTLEPFDFYGWTGCNVIAELPGTTQPNDIYIIGAHYDSMTLDWVGGPGADDNASGVAAVVEIARILSQWPSAATIRFIAFDMEEFGLIGSDAYAHEHQTDNIVGMLALDMLAARRTSHSRADVGGASSCGPIKNALSSALIDYGGLIPLDTGSSVYSDNRPFESLGFQAALLIEDDPLGNQTIHTQQDSVDTPDYIDYEYALALTRGVLGWLVDAAGVRPTPPLGDMNCDYLVDAGDINAFVLALDGEAAYHAQYPDCDWSSADCNRDGQVSFADINPFVALIEAAGQQPQVVAKLLAADGTEGDQLGWAVALSGDSAVVGARYDTDLGSASGSAYVFQRAAGTWTQSAKLTASDGTAGDKFGSAAAMDGNVAVVGAPGHDDLGADAGAAYLFEQTGGAWMQVAKLAASDGAAGDWFGYSAAVCGNTVVVGAHLNDSLGYDAGAAYVFERVGGAWTQVAKLTAADGAMGDSFGYSVTIRGDTILIGARNDDDLGANSGSVFVFERVGGAWTEVAKLHASDGAAGRGFGDAVAVNGSTAAVAARKAAVGGGPGAVYVFESIGGVWTQTAKLTAWNRTTAISVAVNNDTALIGRNYGDPSSVGGSTYIFKRAAGGWTQAAKLTPQGATTAAYFGQSVASSGDTAVVGAPLDSSQGSQAGAAYIIDLRLAGTPLSSRRE